jgi:hypothetical protein
MKYTNKNSGNKPICEGAKEELNEQGWLVQNILRDSLKTVAFYDNREWRAKPLRGGGGSNGAAMMRDEEEEEEDGLNYGVHADDLARRGDYTPEKVNIWLR